MKTLLFMALCAIALNAQAAEERKDTVDRYIIDKELATHFDGSQLEGKRIAKYMIAYKDNGNIVEKNHVIYTDGEIAVTGFARANVIGSAKPLIIVDGEEISSEAFSKISANDIEHIKVLKNNAATMLYGDEGSDGVIIVETKAGSAKASPLILIDGHECTADEMDLVKQEDVLNMVVYQAGSNAARTYKEKGRGGVIIVTTKNGSGMEIIKGRQKR